MKSLILGPESNLQQIDTSVIIVSWNAKKYLMDCLESLHTQGLRSKLEIIVVDNASSDGSPEAVKSIYPEVRIIETGSNLGFAKANNIGIRECIGEYVALINSDVRILAGCLNNLRDFMSSNQSVGLCAPRLLNRDMTIQYSCRNFPTLWRLLSDSLMLDKLPFLHMFFESEEMKVFTYDKTTEVDSISGALMFARKKAIKDVGLLDERFFMYSEDVDWCKRFYKAGWQVVFFHDAEAIHYGGASSSADSNRFSVEKERAVFLYWKKHHSKLSQFILPWIFALHHFTRIAVGALLYLTRPSKRKAILKALSKNLAGMQFLLTGRV